VTRSNKDAAWGYVFVAMAHSRQVAEQIDGASGNRNSQDATIRQSSSVSAPAFTCSAEQRSRQIARPRYRVDVQDVNGDINPSRAPRLRYHLNCGVGLTRWEQHISAGVQKDGGGGIGGGVREDGRGVPLNDARFPRPGGGQTGLASASVGAPAGFATRVDRRRRNWLSRSICSPLCHTKRNACARCSQQCRQLLETRAHYLDVTSVVHIAPRA
jgi:hypothetical protein